MSPSAPSTRMIDTHQHLWMLSERRYDWIVPENNPLHADFGPADIASDAEAAGITDTVLVQANDTYEDTFYMLSVAATESRVKGVVGWVPLDRPAEAKAALDLYAQSPYLVGLRALTHTYEDPKWILGEDVASTLALLAPRGLTLDYVVTNHIHFDNAVELAKRHPSLKIVIDHLAKPTIAAGETEQWTAQIKAAAAQPNIAIKLSGLATESAEGWTAEDWQPYVDHSIACFGADRVMLGSDWPVLILAGDFGRVWDAQLETLADLSAQDQEQIHWRTAATFYGLEE